MSDLLGASLTILWVSIFLIFSELLARVGKLSKENARKLIHIGVGNVVFFIPLFENFIIAIIIPATFIIGNYFLSPLSPISKIKLKTFEAGHSLGTIFYPISLTIVIFLFFDINWKIIACFMPLVYGDGFAAVFGPKSKSGNYIIFGNTKSLLGSGIISLFSIISVFGGIIVLEGDIILAIYVSLITGIVAPIIENLSPKGTDNLCIPIILSILFFVIPDTQFLDLEINILMFSVGAIIGLLIASLGFKLHFLTLDGAIFGFILSLYMLGIGGVSIGIQLFLFFILGSIATKYIGKNEDKIQFEFEKGSEKRDGLQALAKSGLPAIMTLFVINGPFEILFYFISAIICSSLVDTLSTEIGIKYGKNTYHIFRPRDQMKVGETGGISIEGTIGGAISGLIYSVIIMLSSYFENILLFFSFKFILIISISGLLGMLCDSFIGSTLQRKNECTKCGKILENKYHNENETVHVSGIKWFSNDLTNFLGTTLGGMSAIIMYLIF